MPRTFHVKHVINKYFILFYFFQNKAADIISRASDLLKKGAQKENLGPVRVEENSRSIYTSASNVLEASKETSQSFVTEGKCELVCKSSIPSLSSKAENFSAVIQLR